MTSKEVGDLLRMCREWNEMSQEELGKKLHINRTTVSRIENGHDMPQIDIIVEWARTTRQEGVITAYLSQAISGHGETQEFIKLAHLVRDVVLTVSKFQSG